MSASSRYCRDNSNSSANAADTPSDSSDRASGGGEFNRRPSATHRWCSLWDWLIFVGSLVPALLWGIALANVVRGVPLDANMNYVGGFLNLLNPYALVSGLASLALFTLHGALFLILRTEGDLQERSRAAAMKLGPATVALLGLSVAFTYHATD
ncbi:MAG: cytochrome d ubiquinol oxidase subunit II, partial [Armatimonadetes bacterium]|nr:cytochrome d ubiquinol oxidase subunit II [Armatimonadota bacterium]